MKMLRRTAVWTNNLVALLIGLGMYATFAFLPEFVQTPPAAGTGFGASITRSGLMLLPSSITMFAVGMSSAIMGVGFGLAFSAMSALVVTAVPASQTGVASGMNASIRTIGGSMGAAVMASIVTSQLGPAGLPKESGYTIGFAVMAGGLVLAALAGLLIPRPRRTAGEPEHAELAMVAGGTIVGDKSE